MRMTSGILNMVFLGLLVLIFDSVGAATISNGGLRLRIIHTNDMHSRFEEISQRNAGCSTTDKALGKCYGGFARIATLVRQIRDNASTELPTFFLNAGDTYLGSKLFTFYKWKVVARFLNILRPDVASLGNHEFDIGPEGLVPFLKNISFPVVAANLNFNEEPTLKEPSLKKHVVLEAKGHKIGVIGYLTPDTTHLSQTGKVRFIDEVTSIREQAKELKSQGVDIIIALGHSGFEMDKKIGREVEDVDLVIGGHTNTFLYNGPQPDEEVPEGSYPYMVEQANKRKVYVVQAFAYTKYLGDLTIDFDGRGEITNIQGQPILVDNSIAKAKDVEDELDKWVKEVSDWTVREVGETRVLLQGDEKACRLGECNMGNLLTDAMIYYNTKQTAEDNGWTDTAIAIHQAGGIRASIGTINQNKVTFDDVVTALPFGSRVFKVQVPGKILLGALEWSVHDRLDQNTTAHGGCFLQYSGLQVVYNLSKPLNSRVISARARCSQCTIPIYEELNVNANYSILMPDFMHKGGDGFAMFKDTIFKNLNVTTAEVVSNYINHTSPVYPGIEGRIKFLLNQPLSQLSQPSESSSSDKKSMDDNNSRSNNSNMNVERVTYCATPILYLNMGGEMLYVLQQRLHTQKIHPDKAIQVINEVTYALLNPKQLQTMFTRGPLPGLAWIRTSLERVVLSSIMKLDDNSMNKLFDLMIMMVKYQLTTATGPREVILLTLNHLDALRDMVGDKRLREHVDIAHRLVIETYGCMTYKDIWQIKCDCLNELEDHCVRVSILLRLGMQNEDTSFNRLVQRYDEKYQERREVLENFKLLDYSEDESIAGSLAFFGARVTLLGKNVYSPTFGLVSNSRSTQCLSQLSTANTTSARREIESLATQLGREEPLPVRPFSLRLFGHEDSRNTMDCTPDTSKLDNQNVAKDDQGNELKDDRSIKTVDQYRADLIKNIESDFGDDDDDDASRTQNVDIMNMLNIM